MNASFRSILLPAALLLIGGRAAAEDIELFLNRNTNADPPQVLFVIDNAANFSENLDDPTLGRCPLGAGWNSLQGKVGGIEQCALYSVISELESGSVEIGVMVYNDGTVVDWEGNQCDGIPDVNNNKPGGCLVYPMQLLTDSSRAGLLGWIESWRVDGGSAPGQIKGSAKRTGASMQEAWAYFEARTGISGRDYSEDSPESACDRYVIFVGNSFGPAGTPGDQQNTDAGPRRALEGLSGTPRMNASPPTTTAQREIIRKQFDTSCGRGDLARSPHEGNGFYADEWARYMEQAHDITTYSIGVLGERCQASYAATLTSMASVGGGKYFPTRSLDELVTAFQTALSEMLAKNSVFASVSLPVSVNPQGTYLNQVYIGMFRPDEYARSRWHGNLKQYRLGELDGALRLLDARVPDQSAISGADDGFLSPCARSFWTPTTDDTYWQTYKNVLLPFCSPHPAVSNTPDGNLVEKGGQAYTLREIGVAARNMKTCNASCGTTLADFDVGNTTAITKTRLGDADMSDADRTALINWARGENNRGDEVDPDNIQLAAATAMRPSVHGDVLHSRPVAINFGNANNVPPLVVVFYAGNDGVLRAVNGNRSDDIGSVPAGHEMWSFMPPEFYPHISQLRSNSQEIFFHGDDGARGTRKEKPYGFDGPLTAYKEGDATWIFAPMRRGGRLVYAFDVSNIATNANSPTLKWRIGCDAAGNCTSSDIADIGQTWSSPVVMKANDPGANLAVTTDDLVKPMLIMGGGYDDCEDDDPHSCTSTKGNRIFVLDADTGNVKKVFVTERAVAGDVFVISNPTTGRAQWAYAADAGGNVYRISGENANLPIADTYPSAWTITKIAALGCDNGGTCAANRKFLFAPDVVVEPAPNSGTHVLLIGSGDREKPVWEDRNLNGQNDSADRYDSAYATQNYFFMIKDVPMDSDWLTINMGGCGAAVCLDALFEIERDAANPSDADLANKKGWYLELAPHEQVVTSAITVFGGVTFSTHIPYVPEAGACAPDIGDAFVYNVRYRNAAPSKPRALNRYEEIAGGGLPPSPVAGEVRLDDGKVVPFIIGADPRSPLEGGLPTGPAFSTLPKSITYWYIEKR